MLTLAHFTASQARLTQGILLKKIVESIRDLVSEGNLDCNEGGISLQVPCPLPPTPLSCFKGWGAALTCTI